MNKVSLFIAITFLAQSNLIAQKDTARKQTIDITSSYQPVLRNAVKINFSGSQLTADTSMPSLAYEIPSLNLFYAYQPISLRPLALAQDTNLYLGRRNYIKAGFGMYTTPLLDVGLSVGDGKKSLLNFNAAYIASKGNNIKYQDYSLFKVKATGSVFTPKNEVYAAASFSMDNYYLYGYDQLMFDLQKSDVRQQFQEIELTIGTRNITKSPAGINYNPSLQFGFFTNTDQLSESNIIVDLPASKKINDKLNIQLTVRGDFTNYATKNFIPANISFGNNVLSIAPAVEYNTDFVKINAGVTPTWSNGKFAFLPDITADIIIQDKAFMIQSGIVGRIFKNTFRNLSTINPYLATMTSQENTRETEIFAGIKASLGKHFNFSAKGSYINYRNLALFVNDANFENTFVISNETKANNLRIHGDINYINKEKFTVTAGLTLNGYTGLQTNASAWHTVPMEFNGALRWWPMNQLMLKSDVYFYNGGKYRLKTGEAMALPGATDVSIGAEYKINHQFSAWISGNNLFNDKYQRWHNYEVYGLNVTAGVLINF
ncbi:MAG: hypothetical protein WEA59_03700 [Ferruginibacter sp.]